MSEILSKENAGKALRIFTHPGVSNKEALIATAFHRSHEALRAEVERLEGLVRDAVALMDPAVVRAMRRVPKEPNAELNDGAADAKTPQAVKQEISPS